jgi:two-component system response regulator
VSREVDILLVEDDPGDLELTLHAFEPQSCCSRIESVRDGEQALDFLFCRGPFAGRDPRNGPRLILLDLKLPKVDGLEVLREIKQHPSLRLTPAVILTSSGQESDLVAAYQLGANSYVHKPVDYDSFRAALQQLVSYWLRINQAPRAEGFQPGSGSRIR